jgi:hypothetical protein
LKVMNMIMKEYSRKQRNILIHRNKKQKHFFHVDLYL